MIIADLLFKILQTVNETVFPSKCLVCENFFQPSNRVGGSFTGASAQKEARRHSGGRARPSPSLSAHVCPQCLGGLIAVESPLCNCCGLPFKSRQGEDHRCGDCMASPNKFRIARAAMVYEKIFTEIIQCFKYKSKVQLAGSLGELLLTTFRLFWDKDNVDVIVPVPLHPKRLRERGFNQAYLLIRDWETEAAQAIPGLSRLQVERDVLVRTIPTAPQTALGRAQRTANVKNAFEISGREKIEDKRILLVDDVYTTGATVNECARLLLKHGAAHVDVLTLARAV